MPLLESNTNAERLWFNSVNRDTNLLNRNAVTWRPARGTRQHRSPTTPPKAFHEESGFQPYTFPRSTKHTYKSLACSQDFSIICWRVKICSVVLRPRRKPHWESSSFDLIIFAATWHTLFLGGYCRGSWFIHSCLHFLYGTINLLIFRHPSETPVFSWNAMQLHTHESAKPPSVLSSPNLLSNVSQLAFKARF